MATGVNKTTKSKRKTIVSIVGARPQFVKLAALATRIGKKARHLIVHTGQHYDLNMSGVFFKQLDIPRIDYNLKVGSGLHGEMTGEMMIRLEKLFLKIKPDFVLVYGDTNSTLAGAIVSAKMRIPIGHVEAGLRSFDDAMPEEINRRVTDHLSNLLFAPTATAIANLKKEGVKRGVVRSGDLMYELIDNYRSYIDKNSKVLDRFGVESGGYCMMTIHRAGNVDNKAKLEKIVRIIEKLKTKILFPIHPHTLKSLKKFKLYGRIKNASNCIIVEPLSYLDNLTTIANARAVLTDSGGIQKEAIFLKTPCLTMREQTEWTETLKWGNHLVGLSYAKINSILKQDKIGVKSINYKISGKRPSDIIIDGALKAI